MPIYEFVCELCGGMIERLQKMSDPPPEACKECGGKMAKIMSRNSFQLKGGGWYKDLYSSASAGTSSPAAGATKAAGPGSAPAASTPASAPASSTAPAAAAPATKSSSSAGGAGSPGPKAGAG